MQRIEAQHLDRLRADGFIKLEAFFDRGVIERCKAELESAVTSGRSPAHILTSSASVHVHNFFLYGDALRTLLFGPELQSVHKTVFGGSYCMRNAVASTIHTNAAPETAQLHDPIGAGWHRDTPQYNTRDAKSRVLGSEFTFQVIVAIDGSNASNSTKVLPGSHLAPVQGHKLDPDPGKADAIARESHVSDLLMQPGDLAIIDDNVFHKAGLPTAQSRWMLFCSYTPWYVKPYFDFAKVDLPDMTPYEAHCLHKTSTPPLPLEPLRNTFTPNRWEDA
jgi:hypothetical protein